LKWPYHLWHLGTLLEAFPDATVIHIHRRPCEAIASVCSLAALARAPFCESIDAKALGRFWLDYSQAGLEQAFAVRRRAHPQKIIDVMYTDLISDPLPVVQRILTAAVLQPDESWMIQLKTELKSNPKKRNAGHSYDLSQFGLHRDEVRDRFATYLDACEFA